MCLWNAKTIGTSPKLVWQWGQYKPSLPTRVLHGCCLFSKSSKELHGFSRFLGLLQSSMHIKPKQKFSSLTSLLDVHCFEAPIPCYWVCCRSTIIKIIICQMYFSRSGEKQDDDYLSPIFSSWMWLFLERNARVFIHTSFNHGRRNFFPGFKI